MSKDDYWKLKDEKDEGKQATIQYQASRNSAIALLDVLVKNNLVKLPPESKMADRYDATLALLETLTAKFQDETDNLGGVAAPNLGGGNHQDGDDGDGQNQNYDDNLPEYQGDN
jgi:hypothetical protein